MLFSRTINRSVRSPVERKVRHLTRTSSWAMSKLRTTLPAKRSRSTYVETARQRRSWRCHSINDGRGAIHCALEGRHLFMANLNHPANLKYNKTDEWIRVDGDQATIGITDYAQDQLGYRLCRITLGCGCSSRIRREVWRY